MNLDRESIERFGLIEEGKVNLDRKRIGRFGLIEEGIVKLDRESRKCMDR